MKKYVWMVAALAFLLFPMQSIAGDGLLTTYRCMALTGGGTGALDKIPAAELETNDGAIVMVSGVAVCHYVFDGASSAAESSPSVITPNDSGGAGRWILVSISSGSNTGDEPDASSTVKGIIEIADDTEALAGTDTGKAVTPAGVKIYADANDDTGLVETAIDASSELAAIMDDETGTGYLCFNTDTDLINPRIKNGATGSGILSIFEDSDDGTNKATFQVPALTANTVYTLPANDGDASQFLQTNGSGTLTWAASGGSSTGYIDFPSPAMADNTGAAITGDVSSFLNGQASFSNSADSATNYVRYPMISVPRDIDTAVDLTCYFKFILGNSDSGKHRYIISMANVSDSGGLSAPTFTNAINLDFAGDASGAQNDVETIGPVTLTSWKSSLTAGDVFVIKVARDGDDGTNDTSVVNSYTGSLLITYGK